MSISYYLTMNDFIISLSSNLHFFTNSKFYYWESFRRTSSSSTLPSLNPTKRPSPASATASRTNCSPLSRRPSGATAKAGSTLSSRQETQQRPHRLHLPCPKQHSCDLRCRKSEHWVGPVERATDLQWCRWVPWSFPRRRRVRPWSGQDDQLAKTSTVSVPTPSTRSAHTRNTINSYANLLTTVSGAQRAGQWRRFRCDHETFEIVRSSVKRLW